MEVLVAKILIIFGLLLTTLFAGLLPLLCLKLTARNRRKLLHSRKFCCNDHDSSSECPESAAMVRNGSVQTEVLQTRRKKSRTKVVVSILNCFAGGIFLGTSFIGLLPEIRECFEKFDIRWPAITSSNRSVVNLTNITSTRGHGASNGGQSPMPIAEIIVVGGLFFILCVEQAAHAWNHHRQKTKHQMRRNPVVEIRMSGLDENLDGNKHFQVENTQNHLELSDEEKSHHDHSAIRSLILVATLSLHSLFEGVAIGLQEALQNAVSIFVAVLLHKSLMAFSMGTNLVHSDQNIKKVVAAAAIFALASPIGIVVGLIIQSSGGDNSATELINAILQAIATGTFLYITFFEVLVKEFESHGNRLAKVVSLFVGYGSVLGTFFANNG